MEINSPPLSSKLDWLLYDRQQYIKLSFETSPPWPAPLINQNSFCNACLEITKERKHSEFSLVRQRNAYYDFMSYVFEYSSLPSKKCKDIKFFHATTVVTTWAALGAVEGIASSMVLSKDTISLLSEVNRLLFSENMYVIFCLLFAKDYNFPFEFINNNPCVVNPKEIDSFKFDIQMVHFEQSIVRDYITSHKDRFTTAVIAEINDTLNPSGAVMSLVSKITGGISRAAMKMAKDALGVSDLDFLNYRHRTAIGFATVHIFHKKTGDYNNFLKSIGYIQ